MKCFCKNKDLKELSSFLKTIAEENRLKILCLLKTEEKCVCQITEKLNLPHNLILHHINQIKKTGIIQSKQKGKFTFYQIDKKIYNSLLKDAFNILKPKGVRK